MSDDHRSPVRDYPEVYSMTPADDVSPVVPAGRWISASLLLVIGAACGWLLHAAWIGGAA